MKNKIAPPFKEAEFDIIYGQGISREGDILDLASEIGVVVKSGKLDRYADKERVPFTIWVLFF